MVDQDAAAHIRGECGAGPEVRLKPASEYPAPRKWAARRIQNAEDYCVLSAGIPAEDVQEEWKKGTPLAPELLSAFEVLHSKEELEEKKIERKKEQA